MITIKLFWARFRRLLSSGVAVTALLLPAQYALAEGGWQNQFLAEYPQAGPTLQQAATNCTVCHTSSNPNQNSARNAYGQDLQGATNNTIRQMMRNIEQVNSDNDTDGTNACNNITEINADTLPGDAGSTPASCGAAPPVNQPPVANANGPYNGTAGVAVSFSSNGSNDPDGNITNFNWNFGDGTSSTAANPSHTYANAGSFTVTLTVTDNDGDTGSNATTATIDPAPPAPAPNIAVAPTNLNFGVVDVGNSNTLSTTISNNGNANLSVTALNLSGTNEFGLVNPPGTPFTVAPGGSQNINVSYTPGGNGQDNGSLTIASNDADQPSTVLSLNGTGNVPAPNTCSFSATPTSLSFGNVDVGVSATLSTQVSNTGTANCNITASVSPAGGEFSLASAANITVTPGNSATVSVSYSPANAGVDSGNLNLTDSNTLLSVDVALSGNGVDNVPPPQPPVGDCDGSLEIERSRYRSDRRRLDVEGEGGLRDAGNFVLTNAFDSSQILGTDSEDDDRKFDFRVRNLDPVPCSVRVEQPGSGRCAIAEVSNAPADCAPDGPVDPPPANNPPVSDPNGPYTGTVGQPVSFDGSGSSDPDGSIVSYLWNFGDGNTGNGVSPSHTYTGAATYTVSLTVTDNAGASDTATSVAVIDDQPVPPPEAGVTSRGDTYATPVGNTLTVTASRVSGVLYNDFGGEAPLTAELVSGPTSGSLDAFNADGSFTYTPGSGMADNDIDRFTYRAVDANGETSQETTVVVQTLSKQTDFKIMMNYELGMHCTGFEFAYCCVLPPYNSILAQVVKPAQNDPACAQDEHGCENFFDGYPRLLEASKVDGLDGLNRETVVNDWDYQTGDFKKYQLRYYHDAQPRQEGNSGVPNTSTLISAVEGNSLQYFNTVFDSAQPDGGNALVYGPYNGANNVVQGSGVIGDVPTDNYANGWLNHFYIYGNLEGHDNTGLEADKVRLGVAGQVAYPPNSGAALQPMGPTGNGAFENVLTFSADTGTVVFTQAKVLEDLPIMLTSPRIWEALGLPLTPFEDTIDFFGDPGAVDEDAIRPYVAMKASLHEYPSGNAVTGSNGHPVIGFGTAPIDIPNCERCHSAPSVDPATGLPNVNSPNWNRADAFYPHFTGSVPFGTGLEDMTNLETNFWMAYYDIVPGVDSTWYPRLKGAAINMLTLHDFDVGTSFTANYAGVECIDPNNCSFTNGLDDLTNQSNIPQNTRLGHESVICQRCHADNVIANVKSATFDEAGAFPIPPITEAIHNQHRNVSEGGVIVFNDSLGRDGGCQGCHPAHRSDGVMDNYPITLGGNNANAGDDNRLNLGGCFVGRDVHSNPMKDVDGAETPEHLNAIGQWLSDNVANGQAGLAGSDADVRGIWCTNCHTQLGQEIWRTEDCNDLIRGDCLVNPRGEPTLADVAAAVGLSEQEAIDMLDPKVDGFDRTTDQTHRIWDPATPDANVATIEVDGGGNPVVTTDADGDISVNILSFCTTDDCLSRINGNKGDQSQWRYPANAFIDPVNNMAAAVPFSAATDGRDHWLSAGEPHCADCHKAPYVEQSGNITAYPPFNYPAKASLMRYTRGHQDISCQGCHESIHGLYPVTPTIDTTSYAQAAALNNDGSHGPLKCASCHTFVDGDGIPNWVDDLTYNDPTTPGADNLPVAGNFDRAVSWMHTYTDEANPNQDVCQNCHGSETPEVDDDEYLEHAMVNRTSRVAMDNAERAVNGGKVFGEDPGSQRDRLCSECHDDRENLIDEVSCDGDWREHLIEGRVAQTVWEDVSMRETGSTCGW